jgi:hypothetical protein
MRTSWLIRRPAAVICAEKVPDTAEAYRRLAPTGLLPRLCGQGRSSAGSPRQPGQFRSHTANQSAPEADGRPGIVVFAHRFAARLRRRTTHQPGRPACTSAADLGRSRVWTPQSAIAALEPSFNALTEAADSAPFRSRLDGSTSRAAQQTDLETLAAHTPV